MFLLFALLALALAGFLAYAFLTPNGFELFTLTEHKRRSTTFADLLPWARFVAPGVIMNKNGSLQTTMRYRGPDLYSATPNELLIICARLNNIFKRLPGGWALYAESDHYRVASYPDSVFPDPITHLIDQERRLSFETGEFYESDYYLTLIHIPPRDTISKIAALFYEGEDRQETDQARHVITTFLRERARIADLVQSILPEFSLLDDTETLTYLHHCISPKRQLVQAPEVPVYLDGLLPDTPFIGGLAPQLGKHHIAVLTVFGFPSTSQPGLLDALNSLTISYRWVTRYIPLDKIDAEKELSSYQQKWLSARKKLLGAFKEAVFGEESQIKNTDAVNKAADADAAQQELSADAVSYGYFTQTIVVTDDDPARLERNRAAIASVFEKLGFTVADEIQNHNCVDAFLGSIPGNTANNVRHPIVNTLNLSHLFPLSAVWAGPKGDANLGGPPLAQTVAEGNTPYRITLNVGDVGHAILFGPTGMGKSVLLNFLEAQWRRYPDAQVYGFDKGASCLTLTTGVGGDFYDLGSDSAGLAFQPLAHVDREGERTWAFEWAQMILIHEGLELTPERKGDIWTALGKVANAPRDHRTMTQLMMFTSDPKVKEAIKPYTVEGPYGHFLDAEHDTLAYGRWQFFEMGELMASYPHVVMPVLTFLFHRLEERFTGVPTLMVIDEGWLFLDHPVFAPKLREWLKTLRKKKVYVVFASQSPADVAKSRIFETVLESCFTRIFLPNPEACDPTVAQFYKLFGLNDRQLQIIAMAIPHLQYYYSSPLGNRLFDLHLGPLALTYCGATGEADRVLATQLRAAHPNHFNTTLLRTKGLAWAADIVAEFEPKTAAEEELTAA
ncbi:MAG: conjugal transfer protein TrbE [Betaproteobacteria bacterium]|nr:conjugal transfer protein TrbE [Betaproteobacteria bacterium]